MPQRHIATYCTYNNARQRQWTRSWTFFFWLATQGNICVLIIIKMILNGIFNKFYQFYIYLNGFQLYYKSYSIFEWTLDTSCLLLHCFLNYLIPLLKWIPFNFCVRYKVEGRGFSVGLFGGVFGVWVGQLGSTYRRKTIRFCRALSLSLVCALSLAQSS